MMISRLCAEYLNGLWYQNVSMQQLMAQAKPLTPVEAANAAQKLRDDVIGDCEAAILTFADAIGRADVGAYSWSIVKLYYATFYAVRSLLACEGICVFHLKGKPVLAEVLSGRTPMKIVGKAEGTTHGAVFYAWRRFFPNSLIISNPINEVLPFEWLKRQRENANYHQCGFPDPEAQDYCVKLARYGPRKLLNYYLVKDESIAFDPDHAIVAYPFLVLRQLLKKLENENYDLGWADEKKAFAISLVKDSSGPITGFINEVRRVQRNF